MASSFEIVVSRTNIGELTRITQFHALSYVLVENDIGALSLSLPDIYPTSLFETDTILMVYRTDEGVTSLEGETVWFVRSVSYSLNSAGEWLLNLTAYDAKHLLKRRIIRSHAGLSFSSKTDPIDDMMREIVYEQLGSNTLTDFAGDRYIIDVEPDTSSYSVIDKAFAWRNVFEVIKDLSDQALTEEYGSFHVAYTPGALNDLQFKIRRGGWGIDHSSDSGQVLTFSPESGSLANVTIDYDAREEITFVTIGGQGEGVDRAYMYMDEAVARLRTYWNRIEAFVDARNTTSSSQMDSEGRARLAASRALIRFSADVQQTATLKYGVHYRWGDIVAASAHGLTFDAHMSKVAVTADAGGESIAIQLTAEREFSIGT